MTNSIAVSQAAPPTSRLILGGAIFISGFLSPLLIPLVTDSRLSMEWKTAISGVLVLGVPEVFMLIAVSFLGKPGFDYLKSHLWKFIRPADKVSALRYHTGLFLLFLPVLFGWLSPYLEIWFTWITEHKIGLAVAGDLIFAVALFVLGGDFWLKIKALFIHDDIV